MKISKILTASLLAMGSVAASAQTVSGFVGVNSDNVYRGFSLSDDKPSATAGVGVTSKISALTIRGDAVVSTVTNGGRVDTTLTASTPVVGMTVFGGARNHTNFNTDLTSRQSSNEVFGGVSIPVAAGKFVSEYAREWMSGGVETDYVKVGYSRSLFDPKLTLGVSALYTKDVGAVRPARSSAFVFRDVEVAANYKLTPNLNLSATAINGKRDIFAVKNTQKYLVGVNYTF